MVNNILITGGSGLVGTTLSELLRQQGYKVSLLTRKPGQNSENNYYWDIEKGVIDPEAIENSDVIIHLAGENISAERWSQSQKQKIVESRVKSTNLLARTIREAGNKPKVFISASAVGYYGSITSDKIFTEKDKPGTDFLAQTVSQWEESVNSLQETDLRIVKLRIGVVMSRKGGALTKMMLPLKFGFASPVGSGNQYIPWISLDDLSRMFLFAIENNRIEGVYNSVASEEITNAGIMKAMAKVSRRIYLPISVPGLLLRLIYGEMASILLYGSRVSNQKILQSGFSFTSDRFSEFYKR